MNTPRRSDVVIGIPTYRRPETLARLLTSLAPEFDDRVALVVVGDNADDPVTKEVVAGALDGVRDHAVVAVREPGVAEVRNALVREAIGRRPDWRWLVMLDDDGIVLPGWAGRLVATGERYDAEVTGGPVLGDLPAGGSLIVRNSLYAGRPRFATGLVPMLNGAQNIAINRRIADRLGDPWFRPDLGLCGGEDYDFFKRVIRMGGRLAWCDEAPVSEPTPVERLTTPRILRRAYTSNRVNAATDARYEGRTGVARGVVGAGRRWARNTAAAVVRRDPDRLARCGIDAVSIAGRLGGLVETTMGRSGRRS